MPTYGIYDHEEFHSYFYQPPHSHNEEEWNERTSLTTSSSYFHHPPPLTPSSSALHLEPSKPFHTPLSHPWTSSVQGKRGVRPRGSIRLASTLFLPASSPSSFSKDLSSVPSPGLSNDMTCGSSLVSFEQWKSTLLLGVPDQSTAYKDYLQSINECRRMFETDFQLQSKENEELFRSAIETYEKAEEERRRYLQWQEDERKRLHEEHLAQEKLEKERLEQAKEEAEVQARFQEELERKENELQEIQHRLIKEKENDNENENKTKTEKKTSPSSSSSTSPVETTASLIAQYQYTCLTYVQQKKQACHPLPSTLQRAKMQLNRTMGQITNTYSVLQTTIHHLVQVLQTHPRLEYTFAKCVTAQAALEIGRALPRAYALAHVVIGVLTYRPELTALVYGTWLKKCPYIMPRYPSSEGHPKDQHDLNPVYLEQMGGIVALFAACLATVPFTDKYTNPFDFKLAWTWLSHLLNQPPRSETGYFLNVFLTIAGHQGVAKYGHQAKKLVHFLETQYIPLLPSTAVADKERLMMCLAKYRSLGTFEKLKESVPTMD
ncbi:Nuclear pore complex nucleoporin component [Coelomomyces lativittatus]|nr:Nuclear pore complex nucleoporin component [Coelomomyces lativittatus]KAJ1514081.1 Nuclear pore complex nucleoporin component [Coelomomyces lativittatus]KAJ1515397.1 Nuclear pore complex nucleoporin component [Coelomomyces lativittatus]